MEPTADWRGVSPFRRRVYQLTTLIPAGRVATYGALAQAIGCSSPRAVGQALKNNPFAPFVPCHRVIRGDLTIGGFAGHSHGAEVDRKLKLLKDEGVRFENGRLLEPGRLWTPPSSP